MFIKFYSTAFLTFLVTGTLIAASSNSWLFAWLGLEVNLMSMIPLLMISPQCNTTEPAIKYFLPQALASILLVASFMINYMETNLLPLGTFNFIISGALLMKLGMAPLHFWVPQVLMKTPWAQAALILTWQKAAPFMLMSYFMYSEAQTIAIFASSLAGSLGGLNQNNMKLILAYSSIGHSSWMMGAIFFSINAWVNYFLIYCLNTLLVIAVVYAMKIINLKQNISSSFNLFKKTCLMLSMLSMGGLPPFLGFYAKLYTIILMLNQTMWSILMILIAGSLVTLFYYLKVSYNALVMISLMPKINPSNSFFKSTLIFTVIILGAAGVPILVLLT